jgi:hypothetical protein
LVVVVMVESGRGLFTLLRILDGPIMEDEIGHQRSDVEAHDEQAFVAAKKVSFDLRVDERDR